MVIEAIPSPTPSPTAEAAGQPADELSRLSDILLARGALDTRTLERARRVAADTGGRLDRVLTQLGMVSERDLAEALAELVGSVLISPADYPEAPLFVDRLKPKFLHKARALPIADTPDNVILAMADPLDGFVSGSIAAALGRPRSRSPSRSSSKLPLTVFIPMLSPEVKAARTPATSSPMPNRARRIPNG
jgi:general secretion pathway protein E